MIVELRALEEMRLAAKLMKNVMVAEHNKFVESGGKGDTKLLKEAIKDYVRVQAEITPYEDARLATVTVKGDKDNPLRSVTEYDFSKLSDDQLLMLRPILQALAPTAVVEGPATTH